MVAALLGFMAISGLVGRYNLAGLALEVTLPNEVYAGVETLATLRLTSRKRFPSFLVAVELGEQSVLFPLLGGGTTQHKPLAITLPRRGRQTLPDGLLRSRFPVNFFVRSFSIPTRGELTVFPAPVACRQLLPDSYGRLSGRQASVRRGGDGDIERIGEYSGSEPLKMIHWKLTARHDTPLVKELAATASEPLLLDLARLPGGGVEQQLGCATWLVKQCLRRNQPVGLQLPQRLIPPATGQRHRLQLLTELALYGPDPAEA